jgi:hypothetical protein
MKYAYSSPYVNILLHTNGIVLRCFLYNLLLLGTAFAVSRDQRPINRGSVVVKALRYKPKDRGFEAQ